MGASRFVLLVVLLFALPSACAAAPPVPSVGDGSTLLSRADQLAGVYLTWQESARSPQDTEGALAAALAVVGVDLPAVQATTPSLSGLLVAERVTQAHPALQEHAGLIARLWTLAIASLRQQAVPGVEAGGPMTMAPPPARAAPRRARRKGGKGSTTRAPCRAAP